MTAPAPLFVVDDEMELLALWRLVAEAKFAESPDDRDLWGSPFVNALSKRLGEGLREAEVRRGAPGGVERHDKWVRSLRENVVLPVIKRRLKEEVQTDRWRKLGPHQKSQFVRECVSPFVADDELVEELIREAEA